MDPSTPWPPQTNESTPAAPSEPAPTVSVIPPATPEPQQAPNQPLSTSSQKSPDMSKNGRPEHDDEQYEAWLNDMSPFLKQGATIWYAMEKAALLKHKDSIYKKYKLKDWFSEKIDAYRAFIGELTNNVFAMEVKRIWEKRQTGEILTKDELDTLRFVADKHRTSQPFFAQRTETAKAKDEDFGKVVDVPPASISYVIPAAPTNSGPEDNLPADAQAA